MARTPEGERRLSELRLGDEVLARDATSGSLVFSEVLLFVDRVPDERRQFLRLRTAGNRTLTLTPTHLVPVARRRHLLRRPLVRTAARHKFDNRVDGDVEVDAEVDEVPNVDTLVTEFAERVVVGDKVLVRGATRHDRTSPDMAVLDTVVDVQLVLRSGVFAPLTRAGTVVVDDVVASCYAVVDSQRLAHWAFAPVRAWYNLKESVQRLARLVAHPLSAPHMSRQAVTSVPGEGVHWYADALYSLARSVLPARLLHQ